MSSFYSISIPEPISALQQLAQILYRDEVLTVFWLNNTRQVVLERAGAWHIQPNGSVTRSLAALLQCAPHHLVASSLFFFETPGHGVAVDTRLSLAFYSCEWSDYACDKIALQFNLTVDPTLQSDDHRMTHVIGDLLADRGLDDHLLNAFEGIRGQEDDPYAIEYPRSGYFNAQTIDGRVLDSYGDENDGQHEEEGDEYDDMPALIPLDMLENYTNELRNANNINMISRVGGRRQVYFHSAPTHRYMTRSRARAQ